MACYYNPIAMSYVCDSSSSGDSVISVVPGFLSSSGGLVSSSSFEYDFREVARGFSDYNEIFVYIFACFLVVRLLNMIK